MDEIKHIELPWSKEVDEVAAALGSSANGLSSEEAARRRAAYGPNSLPSKRSFAPLHALWRQIANPLIVILLAAAGLSGALGDVVEVVVILAAIAVNVGLGFYREYSAETTIERLASYVRERVRVLRDGREHEIDSSDVVVGDVVVINYGSRMPADAIVLTANGLRFDEAILTGESVAVSKRIGAVSPDSPVGDRHNVAHAGTLAVEGAGAALVYATGAHTEIGRIAGIVSTTERVQTPIEHGVDRLAWIITGVVAVVVALVFALGITRGEETFEMLKLSAAVAVGAVPEALPIALTIILAIGAERIAARKGVVRTLAAAETLGSTTLVMTDKTGTLTLAQMQLVGAHPLSSMQSGETESSIDELDGARRDLLALAVRNLDVVVENPEAAPDQWVIRGRPLEVNIARVAARYGVELDVLRDGIGDTVVPFGSAHKFSVSKVHGDYVVMGAPDVLVRRSTLSQAEQEAVLAWIERESYAGKRIVGVARAHGTGAIMSARDVEQLEFSGVLAFRDPVRVDVPDAIKTIRSYGIDVALVTGDLKGTAIAIARELGWDVRDSAILTGADIRDTSDEQLMKRIEGVRIFARVTPEDKLRIGRAFRARGEVVAMTGDGVNDAPALKAMDIGISLGSGSDVAKSVADLVLLDDGFATIGMAVGEGRKILANIRKTFVYLMSNSLDEVFLIGGALLFALPMPLSALQIIWVNLFTGSLPALAFAFDRDLDEERHSSTHRAKSVFTREVTTLTFGVGTLSSILLFLTYWGLLTYGVGVDVARSVLFACFASYILAVAYSFRSLRLPLWRYRVFENMKLNGAIALAAVVLIATYVVEPMREAFALAPLSASWLWFIAVWLVLNVVIVEAAKAIVTKMRRA